VDCTPIVGLMVKLHALDRVPRAGFLLRGVAEPESVAAHSHAVALLVELVCNAVPGSFDAARALAMALVHDAQEVVTMDIPMPAGDAEFRRARSRAEELIFRSLFARLPERYSLLFEEYERAETPEARLVRGLDKLQMMIKVLCYEREGRGRLAEFWENPANFRDYGIEPVRLLFEEVARLASREIPSAAALMSSHETDIPTPGDPGSGRSRAG
jgi:putative hydrolase of HD superfamily